MELVASTRRRRLRGFVIGGLVVLVGAVAFVLVWFEPQKLWIDDRVHEASPVPAPVTGPDAAPGEVARGDLVSLDHATAGHVVLLRLSDGRHVVRLEGLDTSNGPDLYVYLTANRAAGPEAAFDDDYVSLGRLKGNLGDQNYEVPAGADLARHATLVIWCDRFNSAFGAADLAPSPS